LATGKGVELAVGYISIVPETSKVPEGVRQALKQTESHGRATGQKIGKNVSGGLKDTLHSGASDAAAAITSGLSGQAPSMAGIGRQYGGYLTRAMKGAFNPIEVVGELHGAEKAAAIAGGVVGRAAGLAIKGGMTLGVGAALTVVTTAVGGLGVALSKGFERLKNIDVATQQLKAMGRSADEVKSIMKDVTEVVKGTLIALDEAMGAVTVALGSGVKAGTELKRYLTDIADVAGYSKAPFNEIALIFGQVQAKGKLMGEEMMQLMEHKVPIKPWLMETLHKTSDELDKMSQKGQITMAMMEQAIEGHAAGMAKNLGNTMEGAEKNVSAALGRIGAAILGPILGMKGDGSESGIAKVFNGLSEKMDVLATGLQSHEQDIKAFFLGVAEVAVGALQQVDQFILETVHDIGLISQSLGEILHAMSVIGKYTPAGAIGIFKNLTGDEIDKAADGLKKFGTSWENLNTGFDQRKTTYDRWLQGIKDARDTAKQTATFLNDIDHATAVIAGNDTLVRLDKAHPEFNVNAQKFRSELVDEQTIRIIPLTEQATREMNAWRQSQGAQPLNVKTDVNLDAVYAKMGRLGDFFRSQFTQTPMPGAGAQIPEGDVGALLTGGGASGGIGGSLGHGWLPYDPARRIPGNPDPAGLPDLLRSLPKRDYGGSINGPGPKGRDSVLIWAAPGEHMLTDSDVDKMGGQSGVYAFRSALQSGGVPGFATGGDIIALAEIAGSGRDTPGHGGSQLDPAMPGNWGPDVRWGPNGVPGEDPIWLTPFPYPGWPGPPFQPGDPWRQNRKHVKGYRVGGAIPHFDDGGDIKNAGGQRQFIQMPGGAVAAIDYAFGARGRQYQYGTFDCSEYMSEIYARMAGLPPGRYFNTESDFAALGFKRGFKPGALNIGINHGGGGMNSHMAGTLPNGVPVENSGVATYGSGAKGAQGFSDQWYFEAPGGGGMPGGMPGGGGGMSGIDPGTLPFGGQQGGASGPLSAFLGGASTGRTGGYIPAGAGSTGKAGTSFLSGVYGMAADVGRV
jgi:tape measure domain-containing protein